MFNNIYWFLLLLTIIPLFILKKPRYYLSLFWVKIVNRKINYMNYMKFIFLFTSWLFLVLGCVDFVYGTKSYQNKQLSHRYVLVNDVSGSMRSGDRIKILLSGNKSFLETLNKRQNQEKDLVSCILFDDSIYVVSYFTEDAKFLQEKIFNIDFFDVLLGGGTRVDLALYSALNILLETVNKDYDNYRDNIFRRMYGFGINYKKDNYTNEFILKNKELLKGDSIILFTDGQFSNPFGDNTFMSVLKLLDLCKDLKVRVYLLSIEFIDENVEKSCKETGGFAVKLSLNNKDFEKVYKSILDNEPKDIVTENIIINESLATIFGYISFSFFLTYVVLKQIYLDYSEL